MAFPEADALLAVAPDAFVAAPVDALVAPDNLRVSIALSRGLFEENIDKRGFRKGKMNYLRR